MLSTFKYSQIICSNYASLKPIPYDYFIACSDLCVQMWRCKSNYCSAVASCNGYVDVTSGSEESLLDAIVNVGPIRYNNANTRTPLVMS